MTGDNLYVQRWIKPGGGLVNNLDLFQSVTPLFLYNRSFINETSL
jgi:hypothetical protein